MKPHLLKVSLSEGYSFSVRRDVVPYFYNHWHYHPELELIHILKGSGTQFLGDSIRRFKPGDMILVGSNLPHMWRNDEAYFRKRSNLHAEAIVIHFAPDFMGAPFLGLFENRSLVRLMEKARQGIYITGKTRMAVQDHMQALFGLKGMERIIRLLMILNEIAVSPHTSLISSSGFHRNNVESETHKIDRIYQYVMDHFREKIRLDEIADIVNITPKSFCRYFRSRTRKTFSRFLLEVRIGHACRLLNEESRSIAEVCYESGFNNISNFNRYFKLFTKTTPLRYRKQQQKT
jgi:AraC-like DNA-binding protein